MNNVFVFDKGAHATLADVTASPSAELPTGNGYTRQNKTLSGGTWTEDDTNDKGVRTFDNLSDYYERGSDDTDLAISGGSITYYTPNNGSAISTDTSTGCPLGSEGFLCEKVSKKW